MFLPCSVQSLIRGLVCGYALEEFPNTHFLPQKENRAPRNNAVLLVQSIELVGSILKYSTKLRFRFIEKKGKDKKLVKDPNFSTDMVVRKLRCYLNRPAA